MTVSVFDAAKYVLDVCKQNGRVPVTTWKLQKLVYYSQAWSLVWDDQPLFDEPIQAWANGPVCPALYEQHRGQFQISSLEVGDAGALSKDEKETVDAMFKHYGAHTAQYLSELTHQEAPWVDARKGLSPGQRGNRVIPLDAMAEYYGGL